MASHVSSPRCRLETMRLLTPRPRVRFRAFIVSTRTVTVLFSMLLICRCCGVAGACGRRHLVSIFSPLVPRRILCGPPFSLSPFLHLAQGPFHSPACFVSCSGDGSGVLPSTRRRCSCAASAGEEGREITLRALVRSSIHVPDDRHEHFVRSLLSPADGRHEECSKGV